ncbi:ABC transporter ATP-binding protein [Baekduia soli]|uniref:ABC transporter ATP-binding protein n=1 Tax=Baekduia soli TaxID=496014 RepID=A0A5B8U376_9ACTN|nr:ABC transporter ATP-binding protein [Baekduia soli]QEC47430.1 ABC transporter ATP-binding protein [Baekduia soli]
MTTLLETHGLTKRFDGLLAVDDLDLRVDEGEIFGLIGPNGSGKTTTLHLLTGFLRPTGGTVRYEGREVERLRPSVRASQGLVRTFQLTNVFFTFTALDNVRHTQHLHASDSVLSSIFQTPGYRAERRRLRARAHELLELVGLAPERRDVLAGNLSAGEQRRLEVAMALAADPRLLLLDEPASGLNIEETQELEGVVTELRDRGITVILVEHNMRMVLGLCTRIAVLNFGSKIADGTPAEISADESVVTAYLGARRDAQG